MAPTWMLKPELSTRMWTGLLPRASHKGDLPSFDDLLEIVEWSGTGAFNRSRANSDAKKPSVCRSGR